MAKKPHTQHQKGTARGIRQKQPQVIIRDHMREDHKHQPQEGPTTQKPCSWQRSGEKFKVLMPYPQDSTQFLQQLTLLFNKTKTSGTVYVTLKKYNGQTKPHPRNSKKGESQEHTGESRCLFRATNGKKKLSTVVMHKDVNKFQLAYANLLRANIDNLKKRDKKSSKKAKKTKATQ